MSVIAIDGLLAQLPSQSAAGGEQPEPVNQTDDAEAVPTVTESQVDEPPALSERQYLILQSLLEMNATSASNRCTTDKIAKRAEGAKANPVQFKVPIANLKRRKLVHTKEGRGGGCWLTTSGKTIAEKL